MGLIAEGFASPFRTSEGISIFWDLDHSQCNFGWVNSITFFPKMLGLLLMCSEQWFE